MRGKHTKFVRVKFDPRYMLDAVTLTADTLEEKRRLAKFYLDLRNTGKATLRSTAVKWRKA